MYASTYKAALYTYSNNYYRDQLNTEEKRIYDEFVDMCTEFMTSSETTNHYYLDYIKYDSSKVSKTRAGQIAQLAYYSHPEFFFLENGSVSGSYSDGKTCILSPYVNTYFGSASVRSAAYNKIVNYTNSWMNEINSLSNDLQKETYIAEKICNTVTYISNDFDQSLYGSLICEQAVCNGYAMMMNYFCNAAGINCITVVSNSHAWNNVQLFNDWYVTDTTWMDQKTYIYYGWLNIDNATMLKQDSGQSHVVESNAYVNITLPSCTKTNPTVPSAPALPNFSVAAGNTKATLSFACQNSGGSSTALKFRIFYRPTGTSSWTTKDMNGNASTSYTYTVTGLTNGKKYDFLVLAGNGTYWSKWSNSDVKTAVPTSSVTAPALPQLSVSAGNSQAVLSFVCKNSGSSSTALKFRIFYRPTGTSSWTTKDMNGNASTSYTYTVTGLTNGKKYDFLVLASNGSSWSKWSNSDIKTATPAAPIIAPDLPQLSVSAGNARAVLSFVCKNSGSSSSALKFRVFYRLTGTSSWTTKDMNGNASTSYTYTVTGLTNGKKYDFLVLASNGSSWSKWTNSNIKTATPTAASNAPALPSLKTKAGYSNVNLSWGAVSGATKYSVFYRKTGISSWTSQTTTATSYTVTGLTNGTKYDFLVLAYNGSAWSKWTNANIVNAVPSASGAPVIPSFQTTVGDSQVELSWSPVPGATKYSVFYRLNGESSWNSKGYVTSTGYTVTGLTNGRKYDFLVLAHNGNAASAWTNNDAVSAVPEYWHSYTVNTGRSSTAVLSWYAKSGYTKYRVFYRLNGTSKWTSKDTTGTQYTIKGLTNGKKYDFLVLAYNGYAWSKYSNDSNSIVTMNVYDCGANYGIVTFPRNVYVYSSNQDTWIGTGYGEGYGSEIYISVQLEDYINHRLLINGVEYTLTESGDEGWYGVYYTVNSDVKITLEKSQWSASRLAQYATLEKDSYISVFFYNQYTGYITNEIANGQHVRKGDQICVRISKDIYPTKPNIYINNTLVDCSLNDENMWQIWNYQVPNNDVLSIHVK